MQATTISTILLYSISMDAISEYERETPSRSAHLLHVRNLHLLSRSKPSSALGISKSRAETYSSSLVPFGAKKVLKSVLKNTHCYCLNWNLRDRSESSAFTSKLTIALNPKRLMFSNA